MPLQELEQDRALFRQILDDLVSGRIVLRQGQDEYIISLARRIASIEEKLKDRPASEGSP